MEQNDKKDLSYLRVTADKKKKYFTTELYRNNT